VSGPKGQARGKARELVLWRVPFHDRPGAGVVDDRS
jgi:hypothetical protein